MIDIEKIPNKPGVYIMKDAHGRIIYVGKAKSLKNRVKAYFPKDLYPRARTLVAHVQDLDYIVTSSEIEALILEANLIKLHLPRYNIKLKDDKKYPYIKVTINEDFPRVFPTRDLRDKKSIYFGPYTNVKTMKKALKAATGIFPVRICKGKLPKRICVAYDIGRCYAPCEGKISKEEYRARVQELVDFLSGKSTEVEQSLEKRMHSLAENLEFEEAARVRDRLMSVRQMIRKQRIVFSKSIDADVLGLSSIGNLGCVEVLKIRDGRMIGGEHYIVETRREPPGEVMRAFILQYYRTAFFIPDEIILPMLEDFDAIQKWLSDKKKKEIKVTIPKMGEKTKLINLAEENAKLHLQEERGERVSPYLSELKEVLHLEKLPYRIEAYDISNIRGKYTVGSCVVFVGGHPQKSSYRRYKIKTVRGIDDFRAMGEVVRRRMKRIKEERGKLPDLILVDGGIGQVHSVQREVKEPIPIFGLAKRLEELHTVDGKVLSLPKDSVTLKLLMRIRDEAHRFAITYHRKLRDRTGSILDEIPGIGEKKRQELLRYFISFGKLKEASKEEIAKVPGIGGKHAERIYNYLHGEF
jgi:excinuclease ABC subunit C